MIFRDTYGIFTARLSVTNIVTSVGEPVAQLGRGTINVINTWDGLAAGEQIVGIACKWSRWALTLCLMIVSDTDCKRSALDILTGGSALQNIRLAMADAHLRLVTFGAGFALIYRFWLATVSVVRVTGVAGQALTGATMVGRYADRVWWASELGTNRDTLKYAEDVSTTRSNVVAFSVVRTLGNCGFFATR